MSGKPSPDIILRSPFTHVAHSGRLSLSDMFSSNGNTLFGLGERWCLGRVCRMWDMTPDICCRNQCFAYSIGPYWQVPWRLSLNKYFSSPSDFCVLNTSHMNETSQTHAYLITVPLPDSHLLYSHMDSIGHITLHFVLESWQDKFLFNVRSNCVGHSHTQIPWVMPR